MFWNVVKHGLSYLIYFVCLIIICPSHHACFEFAGFRKQKYTAYDRFHGNGPYGEIPTEKEPIRTLGFTLPYNKEFYNIARALGLSHSVHVSVLKIPIVPADSVSKLLRQKCFVFSRERPLLARGKISYFAIIMDTNRRLGPPVPKRRQFCDLFSWVRVLKWGRKREKQRKLWLIFHLPITSDIAFRFSRWIWCTIPPAML